MLGIKGDLVFSNHVVAWEICPEMDVETLEREIREYMYGFSVVSLDEECFCYKVGLISYHAPVSSFIYVILSNGFVGIKIISKDEFFKKFKSED